MTAGEYPWSNLMLEGTVIIRTICILVAVLALPSHALAARYMVQPGDSLALIAHHYHVSVASLARVNGIRNINLIRAGSVLVIPTRSYRRATRFLYHVRWGDSLSIISARYRVSVATIRALNPSLGPYPLAGQWLVLYRSGSPARRGYTASRGVGGAGTRYIVRVGDTLSGIAAAYGVSQYTIMAANHLQNPNHVELGASLIIPAGGIPQAVYDPWAARSLIAQYAAIYGLEASWPLGVAYEESGFNQTAMSATGAIGVMQVEPYTAAHINTLLGTRLNMHVLEHNIRAGVYWLSVLFRYYGGDERLATAAYYEGSRALARHGMYRDTVQYVANVMALKARFGG